MNDWWNDPPEQPEPPECCGQITEPMRDGGSRCVECGKRFAPESGPLPEDDGTYAVPERFEAQEERTSWSSSPLITATAAVMAIVLAWVDCGTVWKVLASTIIVLLEVDRRMLEEIAGSKEEQ